VATARRAETLVDLQAALKVPLDVTQGESIKEAVDCALQRFGRIDMLVNNAGYALRGAIEEISAEQLRQLFDVNVYGVLRMIRAVAPHMRQQQTGHIINIGSISGKLSTPVNGTYSATKFALEALSDALRLELAPFGVQVVLIEPGSIKTQFADTARARAQAILSNPASPYQPLYQQDQRVSAAMRRHEPGPEVVSQVIQRAIEASRPKARYLVAVPFSGRLVLHLGDSAWDVAEAIGQTLAASGAHVEVRAMHDVQDLAAYRAVVAGSAIQAGQWLPEAMQFMQTHRAALVQKPLAAFLVCMTLAMPGADNYREHVATWLESVRALVRPLSEGLFAGALDISKIPSFRDRLKFRLSVAFGVWREGDHRDWNAIRAWASDLAAKLQPAVAEYGGLS
jgi:NADP-dependent 3-hydroxy acid dehydrogenase YdfG/menaquinone-dependent protoporphyrinogen IX oxidase